MSIPFQGLSGRRYEYYLLDGLRAENINAVPGNYVMAKRLPTGVFAPIYFGESGDLKTRLPNHPELWAAFNLYGANCVLAHANHSGEQGRCAEERDLIAYWNPPLNVQHRSIWSR